MKAKHGVSKNQDCAPDLLRYSLQEQVLFEAEGSKRPVRGEPTVAQAQSCQPELWPMLKTPDFARALSKEKESAAKAQATQCCTGRRRQTSMGKASVGR